MALSSPFFASELSVPRTCLFLGSFFACSTSTVRMHQVSPSLRVRWVLCLLFQSHRHSRKRHLLRVSACAAGKPDIRCVSSSCAEAGSSGHSARRVVSKSKKVEGHVGLRTCKRRVCSQAGHSGDDLDDFVLVRVLEVVEVAVQVAVAVSAVWKS